MDRTFPRHIMFVEENGQGQQSLRRLLRWYASLDTEVGYCQGMGFLAGLFLTYMVEEQAFYTFYSILTVSIPYHSVLEETVTSSCAIENWLWSALSIPAQAHRDSEDIVRLRVSRKTASRRSMATPRKRGHSSNHVRHHLHTITTSHLTHWNVCIAGTSLSGR